MLPRRIAGLVRIGIAVLAGMLLVEGSAPANAQERLPWERSVPPGMQKLGNEEEADQAADPPPAPYRPDGYGRSGYPQQQQPPQGSYPQPGYSQPNAGYPQPGYSQPNAGYPRARANDAYAPPAYGGGYGANQTYGSQPAPANDAYRPPSPGGSYGTTSGYGAPMSGPTSGDVYRPQQGGGYGAPYAPPPANGDYGNGAPEYNAPPPRNYDERPIRGYYTQNEIVQAGHGFFGSVSRGLASVIEYTFQKAGRPNGYILGEDAGGAFVAGLRYGEGRLFTKDAGTHKVFWQGPSLGYDVGAEGSKTMVLVYNLRDPGDIYHRFGGLEGSAYLVGGVSVQFQKYGDVVLAPIRSGLGVRLGANVGYLKYTRSPTWNPF